FRLLKLFPEKWDDLIEYEVEFAPPGPAADYEALSYVWGDPINAVEIICNGTHFPITCNLKDSLQHLRLPDCTRTLCVDAIWIYLNHEPDTAEN
ncbi:hypothetical protein B0J11DRAFT_428348, partial [Dendryphion nanum]